jgi:hypothetical protein
MTGRRAAGRVAEYERPVRASARERTPDHSIGDQPPILNILVPHTGQVPWVAGFPFFIVIFCSLVMSRFALHLTQ